MYIARWNYYPGLDADVALSSLNSSADRYQAGVRQPGVRRHVPPEPLGDRSHEREKICRTVQAFLFDEAPCAFLVRQGRFYGFKRSQGFKPRTDTSILFEEMRWA